MEHQYAGFLSTGTSNAVAPTPYTIARGLQTGSSVYVEKTGQFLNSVMFYDNKGRVLQTQSDNHKGGLDIVTNQYDFSGKVLRTYSVVRNPEADDYPDLRFLSLMLTTMLGV